MIKIKNAFNSFSVDNKEKAIEFYTKTLGLQMEGNENGIGSTLHLPSGNNVFVYMKKDHKPATFTIINFVVGDIEEAVDDLVKKGVHFETYDMEYIKTDEKGISRNDSGRAMAWFKDPAGNFLSLVEEE